MSYFSRFPFIEGYEIQGIKYTGLDLTRRVAVREADRENANLYIDHRISDGETPIVLSDRLYGEPDLHWVILIFNYIVDVEAEWPLNQSELNEWVNRAYDDPNGIHHYESASTQAVVEFDWPEYDRVPITNYEHELRLNEGKRMIKVPTAPYARQIARTFKELIAE